MNITSKGIGAAFRPGSFWACLTIGILFFAVALPSAYALPSGPDFFSKDVSDEASPVVNFEKFSLVVPDAGWGSDSSTNFSAAVIYSSNVVDIENHGRLSLLAVSESADSATGDAKSQIQTYGIRSKGEVTNYGDLTVNGRAGTATATSGTYADADAFAEAWNIHSYSEHVDNYGNLSVSAQGGNATANHNANSSADAYGIVSRSPKSIYNDGDIIVHAQGGSASGGISGTGPTAEGSAQAVGLDSSGVILNHGRVTVTARGGAASTKNGKSEARAISRGLTSETDITNSGLIDVVATGGKAVNEDPAGRNYAEARAYGIEAAGNVVNSGPIHVKAEGGETEGLLADDDGEAYARAYGIFSDGDVTNDGAISVAAIGGTSTTPESEPYALGFGIYTTGGGNTIINRGDIDVTAIYGEGTGTDPFDMPYGSAYAGTCGIYADGSVLNSGNITVTASAPEGFNTAAVGIFFDGDGTLTNTGIIRAFGDQAYETTVASGTLTLVDHYNLNLDGNPNNGSIYILAGAVLELNGAALSLTNVADDFQWDTPYRIFENEGTINGNFGLVSTLNPNVSALYHDQGNTNAADDTVSLIYRPTASPSLVGAILLTKAITLTGNLVNQRMVTGFLQPSLAALEPSKPRLYAALNNTATDVVYYSEPHERQTFFLTPYHAMVDQEASPLGYDATTLGFVAGYERQNRGRLYGFHLGYGRNDLDFTGAGFSLSEEDQDVWSAGVHAMGSLNDWTWRTQVTGFYGQHDYTGRTGLDLVMRETADYDSYGVTANLMGGYLFKLGRHLLLPEAGLDYIWLSRKSFTHSANNAAWNIHNSSLDEHQLAAVTSLRWMTQRRIGNLTLTPSVTGGVRYLLTDDELDVHQSVAGSAPLTITADQDETTGTLSASLLLDSQENASAELAYGGEYGDDTTAHSFWVRFNYRF